MISIWSQACWPQTPDRLLTSLPTPPFARSTGTPAKPSITAVNGSASADGPHAASITFLKVYTASGYAIELADVFRTSATPVTDSLANVAHTDAGPWTRTLTVPAKGTYRFKVCGTWLRTVPTQRKGGIGENTAEEGSAASALITLLPFNCRWSRPTSMAPSLRTPCPTQWLSACLMRLPWLARTALCPRLAKWCSGGAPQSPTASLAQSEERQCGGNPCLQCTLPAQCLSRPLFNTAVHSALPSVRSF